VARINTKLALDFARDPRDESSDPRQNVAAVGSIPRSDRKGEGKIDDHGAAISDQGMGEARGRRAVAGLGRLTDQLATLMGPRTTPTNAQGSSYIRRGCYGS